MAYLQGKLMCSHVSTHNSKPQKKKKKKKKTDMKVQRSSQCSDAM